MKKEFILETLRYLIVGVITTIIAISLLWLFYNTCGIEENISNILSNIITIVIAYVLNRVFVFRSKNADVLKESLKFIGSRIIVAIIDIILFYILTIAITSDFTVLSIAINHVLLIKIIVNIVVIILNYLFSKLLVFKS